MSSIQQNAFETTTSKYLHQRHVTLCSQSIMGYMLTFMLHLRCRCRTPPMHRSSKLDGKLAKSLLYISVLWRWSLSPSRNCSPGLPCRLLQQRLAVWARLWHRLLTAWMLRPPHSCLCFVYHLHWILLYTCFIMLHHRPQYSHYWHPA